MKLFILTLFLSFSSLHCGKSDDVVSPEPNIIAPEPNAKAIQCENQDCDESLITAILGGDFEEAKVLLEAGANPNHRSTRTKISGTTPLHALVVADDRLGSDDELGSIDFLPTLLKYGADINIQDKSGSTALAYAILEEKYLLAQIFIQNDNIDLSIKTGLRVIYSFYDSDFANTLARQTFNAILSKNPGLINVKAEEGVSPIHYAVGGEHEEFLRFLLSHPTININLEDSVGNTPLMASIIKNNFQMATDLLAAGADPTYRSLKKGGNTALHILASAVTQQKVDFLPTLFKHGADINAQNDRGRTPIYFATVISESVELTQALVSRPDINMNIQDSEGNTPMLLFITHIQEALDQILSSTEESPTIAQLDKINQILQIILNSSHNIDLTIKNHSNTSSDMSLLFITLSALQIPTDSPYYLPCLTISQTLTLIAQKSLASTQPTEQPTEQ